MNSWILAAIAIAVLVLALLLTRRGRQAAQDCAENFAGICSAAFEQTARKNANKRKITDLLKERGELSNSAIRQALDISDRSVIRYLDELEKEGKVEQIGSTGRNVIYRLK